MTSNKNPVSDALFYKNLFESLPVGLAVSSEDGQLVEINQAYADIVGYTMEEVLQLTYWDITPNKYQKQEEKQLNDLYSTAFYGPYEKEYIHKSGKFVPVRLNGRFIEREGKKLIWSSVENISDKKRIENELKDLIESSLQIASTDYNLKKDFDFKSIEVVRDFAEDLPPVICERSRIQQVFLNILKNGSQAMHEAKIENPLFSLKGYIEEKSEKNIVLEIQDNGPGMSDKIRKGIFEPFYTTKPEGSGTGLGLSVSYFIISELHKGEISVESEMGIGTKFIIKIPL